MSDLTDMDIDWADDYDDEECPHGVGFDEYCEECDEEGEYDGHSALVRFFP